MIGRPRSAFGPCSSPVPDRGKRSSAAVVPGRRAVLAAALALSLGCRTPDTLRVTDRSGATGPRVLAIFAHPDDETTVAGALYKTTTALGGVCDLCVITNGEGGFKYSTLAERIHGLPLTDETVGRAHKTGRASAT